MSDGAIIARVRELVSYYASVPAERLGPDSRPENTPGWDSAANLGILGDIEDQFGVMFSTADAMRLRTIGDLARFVEEQRAEVPAGAGGNVG